jgi:signal transduction histidine kinase
MHDIPPGVTEDQYFVLSNLAPSRGQKRLALGLVLGLMAALYLVVWLFGGIQLGAIYSFVAVYTTGMFVTDSLTAILLYAQFSILRSRAILVIASGYLFTAFLIVPYVLAFPDVFAPNGVVGGLQTTAYLYLLWHCGFPLFVISYTLSKDEDPGRRYAQAEVRSAVVRSVAWTTASAAALAGLCMRGTAVLPRIMVDRYRFVPEWPYLVAAPILVLCSVALVVLWCRRRSILDFFLMVVLCAYVIEIPPQYYPVMARFSTGWYAVRVTSLLSSTIVLVVLLYEITALYGGLLDAVLRHRHEREARLMTGGAVAGSIAHEVRQPLTAMITSADAGFRFLDRTTPNLERAKEAFKRISTDGHRAGKLVESIRAHFKTDSQVRVALDVNELIEETLSLERSDLQKHRILVQAETAPRLPEVRGDRLQLQQVLVNLITNAIDAMAARDEPRVLCVKAQAYERDEVVISVADSGTGISPQDVARIFNPLFTTKADGMGMGLSICRAIIEAHEGRLWVSPNVPQGVVFQFTLRGGDSASADA